MNPFRIGERVELISCPNFPGTVADSGTGRSTYASTTSALNHRRRFGRIACNSREGRCVVRSVPKASGCGTSRCGRHPFTESAVCTLRSNDLFGTRRLVAATRSGDLGAFEELYESHVGYVRKAGQAILGTDDLDDLVQDVFADAWKGLQSFRGDSTFRTWVTSMPGTAVLQCVSSAERTMHSSQTYHLTRNTARGQKSEAPRSWKIVTTYRDL